MFTLFLFLALPFAAFTQGRVYKKIQESRNGNARFAATDLFSVENRAVRRVSNDSVQYLTVNENNLAHITQSKPASLKFSIPFKDKQIFHLELVPYDIYGDNFMVKNARNQAVNVKRQLHYLGIINGEQNSLAAISITDEGIRGFVSGPAGNFELGRNTNTSEYVFYDTQIIKKAFECTVEEELLPVPYTKNDFRTDFYSTAADFVSCKPVEIYFEADQSIFQSKGSVQGAADYVTDVFHQVAVLYANEGIEMVISEIKVWDSPDPYSGTTSDEYLDKFKTHIGTSFNGDLAHALSARRLGGGVAEVDKLCSKGRGMSGNLALSHNGYSAYSWDVNVIAHELGHNLGSRHTHSCLWPGGPIDGCADPEGGQCQDGPMPQSGGTIMSYCHLKADIGINFALGFGPLPGTLIRNRVRDCKGDASGNCVSDQCYEGALILSSQAEVDAFGNNHGNCTIIYGNLEILGEDISNLTPLANLREVRGNLRIFNTILENLSGLSQINKVTGLWVSSNSNLKNLDALSGLEQIDGFIILGANRELQHINGLSGVSSLNGYVEIVNNPKLTSLTGLNGIRKVDGMLSLQYNLLLENFNGLENLEEVTGPLLVYQNDKLMNFAGAGKVHTLGELAVSSNKVLSSFTGFSSLRTINGDLTISNNNTFAVASLDLSGLSSLRNIKGTLDIARNRNLYQLDGLHGVIEIGGLSIHSEPWITSLAPLNNINATLLQRVSLQSNDRLSLCEPPAFLCNYLNLTPERPRNIQSNSTCGSLQDVIQICRGCPPMTSITFSTQEQIDNYIVPPGCEVILENLTIRGNDIENLDALNSIKEIRGNLMIGFNPNLLNLAGLSGLEKIGGELTIRNNAKIKSLTGLENLISVIRAIDIMGNDNLVSIAGLNGITKVYDYGLSITHNPLLTDLSGLSNLTSVSGVFSIGNNNSLQNLNGLSGLTGAMGPVYITENPLLPNVDALQGITAARSVTIRNNRELTNINGLINIERMAGTSSGVTITGNPKLADLSGLAGLKSIGRGGITLTDNPILNNISGLAGIDGTTIGYIRITGNHALSVCHITSLCTFIGGTGSKVISENLGDCISVDAVIAACSAPPPACPTGNLSFNTQKEIDDFGLNYSHCTALPGNVHISGTDIKNLKGLAHVETIGGYLAIDQTYVEDLTGLSKLRNINGFLRLWSNYYLTGLTGLNKLENIGEYFSIQSSRLTTSTGMTALKKIGGSLILLSNNNLPALEGFTALTEIGGSLSMESNSLLAHINGLSNLTKLSGKIDFRNNGLLNLDGLAGLTDFNNEIYLSSNKGLESIEGLKNIPADKITSLTIRDNQGANGAFGLSVCNLPNICTYLNGTRPRTITGNLGDCLDVNAVKTACAGPPQSCPAGDVVLDTQQKADAFGVQYGHCTVIEGSLMISGSVTNLKGLSHIKEIKKTLSVSSSELEDLEGLNALEDVGESVIIHKNSKLNALAALSKLEKIVLTLRITDNSVLESMSFSNVKKLEGTLTISGNTKLPHLDGLSALEMVGGLYVGENAALKNLNGLSKLIAVGTPGYSGGSVMVEKNPGLQSVSLPGLKTITDYLVINDNPLLESIHFPALTATTFIRLKGNAKIEEFGDVRQLADVESIEVTNNAALRNLAGLSGLKNAKGLFLMNNPHLSAIDGIINIDPDTVEELIITGNAQLSVCNLPNICAYLALPATDKMRTISDNLGDCFDEAKVIAACGLAGETLTLGAGVNPTNCGATDGRIAFTTSLSAGNYTLHFKRGTKDTTASISVAAGAFTLSGLGKGGYSGFYIMDEEVRVAAAGERTLTDPPAHTFTISTKTDPTGCGVADGSLAFTTNLAAGSYTLSFKKETKDTTATITVTAGGFTLTKLAAAGYSAFTIVSGGCSYTLAGPVTLVVPTQVLSVKEIKNPASCKSTDGSIAFITNIAAGNYSISFKKGVKDTTANITVTAGAFSVGNLAEAIYSAFSISQHGCQYLLPGPVEIRDPIGAGGNILADGPLELCEGSTVKLTAPEGTSYEWSTGEKTRSIVASAEGEYRVKVSAAGGCVGESAIRVIRKVCNVPPMAVCKPVVVLVANDNCYAVINTEDLDAGSYDGNNDWFNRSIDINPVQRVGSYVATMTVVDIHGTSTSCASQVHVVDHQAPVVRARGLTLELNAEGKASVSVADVNAGSYDNCGAVTLSLNRTEFDCRDLGHHQVILTGTDASGNVATALADITIVDNTPPVVIARNLEIELDENGNASLTPGDLAATIADNCGIWSITVSQTDFTCANLGANKVTLRVEDVQGTVTETEVTVTVADKTAPVVKAEDITLYLDANGHARLNAALLGASATDNCGVDSLTLSNTDFSCHTLGEHEVVVSAWDKSGNATEIAVKVTVADTTAPTIRAKDVALLLDEVGKAVLKVEEVDQGSSDNCGIMHRELNRTAFDCDQIGEHTVEYQVTDSSGNVAKASIRVTVKDGAAPVARAQDHIVELDGTGNANLTAQAVNDGSTDNCTVASLAVSQENFTCEDLGRRLVTLTVKDGSGNESTARAEVLVRDPEGVCPCSYGILAEDKIVLSNNEVSAGGVGVSGTKGLVKLRKTIVNEEGTFVRSENTRFDSESESSVYLRGRAPQPEVFRTNSDKVKKREKIKKGETRTFGTGSFGKIKAARNAKLVFSGGEVKLRDLKLKKGAVVNFTAATVLLVRDKTKMGRDVHFNAEREVVRLYSGGNVQVSSGGEVRAYLHSQGNLKTSGGGEKYMEGFFAAARVKGSRNTQWAGGGLMCRQEDQQALLASEKNEKAQLSEGVEAVVSIGEQLSVRAWPNIFTTQIEVAITGNTPGGEIQLVDLLGNLLLKENYRGKEITMNLATAKIRSGLYILRVSSGGDTRTLRVVK